MISLTKKILDCIKALSRIDSLYRWLIGIAPPWAIPFYDTEFIAAAFIKATPYLGLWFWRCWNENDVLIFCFHGTLSAIYP